MKVYLDMDGTLVDFVSQVNKYGFWRTDKENKVDWKKVKAMGPRFWSEMDWLPLSKIIFDELTYLDEKGFIELYILTSIDFEEGSEGKRQWITNHTNFSLDKLIFVQEPEEKADYAAPDSWLIDDRKKSLEPFKNAGGNIIEFKGNWITTIKELESIITEKITNEKENLHKKTSIKKINNILFEFKSSPAYVCATDEDCLSSGFLIDEDGNYYNFKEKFYPEGLSNAEIDFLSISKNLKTFYKYDLVFKSSELADKIKKILENYRKQINSLPEEISNPGICDGSIEQLNFGNKIVVGMNSILKDDKTFKKWEKTYPLFSSYPTEKKFERNEENLFIHNKIYLEVLQAVKEEEMKNNLRRER